MTSVLTCWIHFKTRMYACDDHTLSYLSQNSRVKTASVGSIASHGCLHISPQLFWLYSCSCYHATDILQIVQFHNTFKIPIEWSWSLWFQCLKRAAHWFGLALRQSATRSDSTHHMPFQTKWYLQHHWICRKGKRSKYPSQLSIRPMKNSHKMSSLGLIHIHLKLSWLLSYCSCRTVAEEWAHTCAYLAKHNAWCALCWLEKMPHCKR